MQVYLLQATGNGICLQLGVSLCILRFREGERIFRFNLNKTRRDNNEAISKISL